MIFIVNSAPGVGKSTLLKSIQEKDLDGFAVLDGDDVGKTVPLRNTVDWLNMIQDNIVSCCINYRRYNIHNAIAGFVLPSEERIQRLVGLLEKEGFSVSHITLYCEDDIVAQRINKRNTSKLMNINNAIECNRRIRKLPADISIDTSCMSRDEVADKVYDFIMSFNL